MHKDPPADFPRLKVVEHVVSFAEMWKACTEVIPWYVVPVACARLKIPVKRCEIWVVEGSPPELLEHERAHCEGRDHPGSDHIERLWAWHKARMPELAEKK